MTDGNPWAQLVSLSDLDSEPIPITTNKMVFGRGTDCDVCLSENKLVSSHHCFIKKDEAGMVTLNDTSTNGTLYNLSHKITKGKSKELVHGDEFYIVYKKNNEELNVGYLFQDMEELRREEAAYEDSNPDFMDATLEDTDCNYISPEKSTMKKRKTEEDHNTEDETPPKRIVTETDLKGANCTGKGTSAQTKDTSDDKSLCANITKDSVKEANITKDSVKEANITKDSVKDSKADQVVNVNTKVTTDMPAKDDIEENLQCMICQEIMHDCVSLQPCLHSFCAGCYSDWMGRSQECPSCRKNVERITKNHIVNNLIEAYLKLNPEKKRPDEDITELNGKNKITNDMLYPKENLRHNESSEYSDSDDDESAPNLSPPIFRPAIYAPPPAPTLFGFGTPFFGTTQMKTCCRQCPEWREPVIDVKKNNDNTGIMGGIVKTLTTIKNTVTGGAAGPSGEEEPGTSGEKTKKEGEDGNPEASTSGGGVHNHPKEDVKVMPDPPPFVCKAMQNHVLCQCCFQPMPDRRGDPNAPAQQCTICYRAYCHAYWGCRKTTCSGCLNKFNEMTFSRTAFTGLILDNVYESEIFRKYIDAKGMSMKDLLTLCCQGLDLGNFSVPAQGSHKFTSNSPTCYACGLLIFRQLALQYRKTIKKEDFPEDVRNRPDCYWGSKCRTQKNKPHHAKNFNHVCDQTRQF